MTLSPERLAAITARAANAPHAIGMLIQAALMVDSAKAAELDPGYIASLEGDLTSRRDTLATDLSDCLAAIEELQADKARLDWLEAQIPTDVGINIYQRVPQGVGLFCMAVEKSADSLREAIDAARSSRSPSLEPKT